MLPVSELKPKIESFWEWFLEMEAQIADFFSEEEGAGDGSRLIDFMNDRVLDFGAFAWEIGPGDDKPFYFILSPNGRKEQLVISKAVIAAAPDLASWDFHYAKPARDWDFQLTIYDDFLREIHLDAAIWNGVLQAAEAGRFRLLIEASNTQHLDAENRHAAAEMVINNILGEEKRIELLEKIEVRLELPADLVENAFPLPVLGAKMEGQ